MTSQINANPITVNSLGRVYTNDRYESSTQDVDGCLIIELIPEENVNFFIVAGKKSPNHDAICGYKDGVAIGNSLFRSNCIPVSYKDSLFVLDHNNNRIRKITARTVTTFVGNDNRERKDGIGTEASGFYDAKCITVDVNGNLYLYQENIDYSTDKRNNIIRKITPEAVVSTIVKDIEFNFSNIAADASGNLYATTEEFAVFKITPGAEKEITVFAGSEDYENDEGYEDGIGTEARFNNAGPLAIDKDGNLYVGDISNLCIRKITPQAQVTTLAGNPENSGYKDAIGTEAAFRYPKHLAIHPNGKVLYVMDIVSNDGYHHGRIRTIDVDTQVVETIYPLQYPKYLTPRTNPPLQKIETGSTDVISSDDIEEGSIVGQIVGEGGTIAKSSYYFPNTLTNLYDQGVSKFIDPYTRKRIVGVNWYTANLVPAGSLGGRRKTRNVKNFKRTTFRKKRIQISKQKKSRK